MNPLVDPAVPGATIPVWAPVWPKPDGWVHELFAWATILVWAKGSTWN